MRIIVLALATVGLGNLLSVWLSDWGGLLVALVIGVLFCLFTDTGKLLIARSRLGVVSAALGNLPRFVLVGDYDTNELLFSRAAKLETELFEKGLKEHPDIVEELKQVLNEIH